MDSHSLRAAPPFSCISFSPHLCCLLCFSTTISKTAHVSQKLTSLKHRHSAQAPPAGNRGYGGEKLHPSQRVWIQTPALRLSSCVPLGKLVNLSVASSLRRRDSGRILSHCDDAQGERHHKCRRAWEWMLNRVECLRSCSVVWQAMLPKSSYVLGKCSTSRPHPNPSFVKEIRHNPDFSQSFCPSSTVKPWPINFPLRLLPLPGDVCRLHSSPWL